MKYDENQDIVWANDGARAWVGSRAQVNDIAEPEPPPGEAVGRRRGADKRVGCRGAASTHTRMARQFMAHSGYRPPR